MWMACSYSLHTFLFRNKIVFILYAPIHVIKNCRRGDIHFINNCRRGEKKHRSKMKVRISKEEEEVEEQPLSPMARVFQSPEVDYCAVTIMGFKTKFCPDVLLDALKHNVSKHPRFSTKLVQHITISGFEHDQNLKVYCYRIIFQILQNYSIELQNNWFSTFFN